MYFLKLSNQELSLIILGICIIPIMILIVYAIIVAVRRSRKISIEREQEAKTSDDQTQRKLFLDVFGGEDNIKNVMVQMSRLSVTVFDLNKVQTEELKELGATGILLVNDVVKCSFGDRASYIYNLIKKEQNDANE
ncbi:MAG: PTS transporter subunit EIIB [Acholeplasmataceae bacterium]|nr:PTS transporter subunit EIIB [Acholeplasmataceae bacterium]